MEFTNEQKEVQEQMIAVMAKCWEDENFKQELLANPVDTIEKFKGSPLNIPEGMNFVVTDQTDPSSIYFNIAAKPMFDSVELTDDQLEAVAGGGDPIKTEYTTQELIEIILWAPVGGKR